MDIKVGRLLATSSFLDEEMQIRLWNLKDPYIRRDLAKRTDLCAQLEDAVLEDDDLIFYWAGHKERAVPALERAVKRVSSERSLITLATQKYLTLELISKLVVKATPQVALTLLELNGLPRVVRDKLIKIYINSSEHRGGSFGKNLTENIGSSTEDWVSAVKSATWVNSGILAQGAYFVPKSKLMSNILVGKLLLVDTYITQESMKQVELGRDFYKDLERVWRSILEDYTLSISDIEKFKDCVFVKSSSQKIKELNERLSYDFKSEIKKLNCKSGKKSKNLAHVSVIRDLIQKGERASLPIELIAYEALVHKEQLDDITYNIALSNLLGEGSRNLGRELIKDLSEPEAQAYFMSKGLLGIEGERDKLLLFLASVGHRDISDRNLNSIEKEMVLNVISPISSVVGQSDFTGLIINQLKVLDKNEEEFAYTLLSTWEGTLPELIEAARLIN